jgi:hypothetical protein
MRWTTGTAELTGTVKLDTARGTPFMLPLATNELPGTP